MISYKEAYDTIINRAKHFGVEQVDITAVSGRILAEDIYADRNYPPFNRSAMDGFAVRADDVNGHPLTITDTIMAGMKTQEKVSVGTCMKIMTGAPVPEGADTVIRVEDSLTTGNEVLFTPTKKLVKGANIATEGEDVKANTLLLEKGRMCNHSVVGVLSTVGKKTIALYQQPRVVILATGSELRDVDEPVAPYEIRDANSYVLYALFQQLGITPILRVKVEDDKKALQEVISGLPEHDLLVLSGGVSMGEADYVPEVLANEGITNIFHKLKIKPGKPVWFGEGTQGQYVFGLPGNPMSVQVGFRLFIQPLLERCKSVVRKQNFNLPLVGGRTKKSAFDEFFPCKVVHGSQGLSLEKIKYNGSGDMKATLFSDGLVWQPADSMILEDKEGVMFIPW